MIIRSFDHLPGEARAIRTRVFVREAAWRDEFDASDDTATHLLAYGDAGTPVATCRFHPDPDHPETNDASADHPGAPARWVIGRLAVLPDHQGMRIGSTLLAEAERRIARSGGVIAAVHSAEDHYSFYRRRGYVIDELYDGGSHGWLIKRLGPMAEVGPARVATDDRNPREDAGHPQEDGVPAS